MTVWYNEIDAYAAQWTRNLCAAGHLPSGNVDERSIVDVQPEDLKGVTQAHFFSGIGGWPLALKLAGWEGPVWTGSCPCQPFSLAGKRKGTNDERHLWPDFFRLIRALRPPAIFGEQVASPDGVEWLVGVRADLEMEGYEVGCADIPACGVGTLHQRQRLWWGAHTNGVRSQRVRPATKELWSWKQLEGLVQAEARMAVPSGKDSAMVDGIPGRMGRLRAYGNAIVPQVAAEFVKAFMGIAPIGHKVK